MVELVLAESSRVVRAVGGVLITETNTGLICANAGIDSSNVGGGGRVALLPADPDASARRIRDEIEAAAGVRPAVVIADSFGRPWRLGQAEVAIGCAGLEPLDDWRGRRDRDGRELEATAIATADQLAAAADLARDQGRRAAGRRDPRARASGRGRGRSRGGEPAAAARRGPVQVRGLSENSCSPISSYLCRSGRARPPR